MQIDDNKKSFLDFELFSLYLMILICLIVTFISYFCYMNSLILKIFIKNRFFKYFKRTAL